VGSENVKVSAACLINVADNGMCPVEAEYVSMARELLLARARIEALEKELPSVAWLDGFNSRASSNEALNAVERLGKNFDAMIAITYSVRAALDAGRKGAGDGR
jgi:hypothetical protein